MPCRPRRVAAVACPPAGVLAGHGAPASSIPVVVGAGDTAGLTIFSPAVSGPAWTPVMTPQLESRVIATAWHLPRALIVAAERGIVVIEMT